MAVSDQQLIFGDAENALLTHIVTVGKYVLYNARRRFRAPTANEFRFVLARDFQSERIIAVLHGRLNDFEKKWSKVIEAPIEY